MLRKTFAAALAVGAVLALPAGATAQGPAQDSVTGSGTVDGGNGFGIDARSGPSGESPTGTMFLLLGNSTFFNGNVTCLTVQGSVAFMKLQTSQFGLLDITVRDNAALGTADVFEVSFATGGASECATAAPPLATFTLLTGDIVIVDVAALPASKDQCKNGGWQTFGVFKNQGDCVSFVATGGREKDHKA